MPVDDEVITRAEMALAQNKKVEREARYAKQMLAALLELLQLPEEAQGESNASSTQDSRKA